MSKPNWKDARNWAGWLAQDGDGEWCFFEFEPFKHPNTSNEVWIEPTDAGRFEMGFSDDPNPLWHETLEKRP